MSKFRVSVIIPAYNNERYIAEAVESVLRQTFGSFEVLIIDDGSKDATGRIAAGFAARHPGRVRCYSQENRGAGAARNLGMRRARGEYIAFLDADDVWLPEKLESQVAALDRDPDIGLVYCDNYFVDKDRQVIPGYRRTIRLPRGRIIVPLFRHCLIITSSAVIRRACVDRIGYFSETLRVGEDYEFFLRLAYEYPVELVCRRLYERRMRDDSLSAADYRANAENDMLSLRRFARQRPDFYRRHRTLVALRLGSYHFDLGYYSLRDGHNLYAARHIAASLRYVITPKSFKCLFMCAVPYALILWLKRLLEGAGRNHEDIENGGAIPQTAGGGDQEEADPAPVPRDPGKRDGARL